MKNIILIGMPASGKSTLGVLLAKELGRNFIDTDILLQNQAGRTLPAIIAETGMEGFLDMEAELVSSLDVQRTVVATGGSVVLRPKAMEILKTLGLVIYLDASFAEIQERVGNLQSRGVILQPEKTLKDSFDERTPLYQKYADITYFCTGGIQDNLRQIVSDLTAEPQ
jgi:shikimate kinase